MKYILKLLKLFCYFSRTFLTKILIFKGSRVPLLASCEINLTEIFRKPLKEDPENKRNQKNQNNNQDWKLNMIVNSPGQLNTWANINNLPQLLPQELLKSMKEEKFKHRFNNNKKAYLQSSYICSNEFQQIQTVFSADSINSSKSMKQSNWRNSCKAS